MPLSTLLDSPVRSAGSREAVVHGEQRWIYREFANRARRAATVLRGAGLRPGDRLAVMTYNTSAFLFAAFGADGRHRVEAAGGHVRGRAGSRRPVPQDPHQPYLDRRPLAYFTSYWAVALMPGWLPSRPVATTARARPTASPRSPGPALARRHWATPTAASWCRTSRMPARSDFVPNAFMLAQAEKTVLRAPFAPAPRG